MFSGFRRILFHHAKPFSGIQIEKIYPIKQSHLEILLEQFLYRERFSVSIKQLESVFGPAIWAPKEEFSKRGDSQAFRSGHLPASHCSWNKRVMRPWLVEPNEKIDGSLVHKVVRLSVENETLIPINTNNISKLLMKLLKRDPSLRSRSLDWEVQRTDGDKLEIKDQLAEVAEDGTIPTIPCSQIVSSIWDGMRRLPYSNSQIAIGIGTYIALAASRNGYAAMTKMFGKIEGVELCKWGSANTRICIGKRVHWFVETRHMGFI